MKIKIRRAKESFTFLLVFVMPIHNILHEKYARNAIIHFYISLPDSYISLMCKYL